MCVACSLSTVHHKRCCAFVWRSWINFHSDYVYGGAGLSQFVSFTEYFTTVFVAATTPVATLHFHRLNDCFVGSDTFHPFERIPPRTMAILPAIFTLDKNNGSWIYDILVIFSVPYSLVLLPRFGGDDANSLWSLDHCRIYSCPTPPSPTSRMIRYCLFFSRLWRIQRTNYSPFLFLFD